MMGEKERLQKKGEGESVFTYVCEYLTSPGSFISAMRYSGSPAGGSTSKINSGLKTARDSHKEDVGKRMMREMIKVILW